MMEIYGSGEKYLGKNWQNYVFSFLIKFLINSELQTNVNNIWLRIKTIKVCVMITDVPSSARLC